MKIKFPVEAFALAMVVFSRNMKEAFVTGILLLAVTVLCELFYENIKNQVSEWSKWASVLILGGAVSYGAFRLAFYTLGMDLSINTWLVHVLLGVLAGRHVVMQDLDGDYDGLVFESAIAYGCLILLGICREFLGTGAVFGYPLVDALFVSKKFQDVMFGLLGAGIGIAVADRLLKKSIRKMESLWVMIPVAVLYRPFVVDSAPEAVSILLGILVPLLFFLSVRKKLTFSMVGKAYRKLPIELMSMGIIYMILNMF